MTQVDGSNVAGRVALRRARWLIEREFDATLTVLPAEEASDDLSGNARPGRSAIQID